MIERIDGTLFEVMLRGGSANISVHEKQINEINVFPVPDGDTGKNMSLTLESGINSAKSNKHLGLYLKDVAKGMLLGARGNSGVILSQLFKGLAVKLESKSYINAGELRDGLIEAYKTAYSAVAHPTEGTILTVAREGVENIISQIRRGTTPDMVMSMYLAEMRKSVRNTPELLPKLKEAGVLDSGAVGYITIVDGMARAMYGEVILPPEKDTDVSSQGTSLNDNTSGVFDKNSEFVYGYCLEFLLQLLSSRIDVNRFDIKDFTEALKKCGNSIVAVQSDSIIKVHIHSHHPSIIIDEAQKYGEFISFKLENMQIQHEQLIKTVDNKEVEKDDENEELFVNNKTAKKERKQLGIIAVADGDGISQILQGLGADIVLSGGQTMNTAANEFVSAYTELNADRIVVFPNNGNIIASAQQAADIAEMKDRITVIPSHSVIEGYFGLAMGTSDIEDIDERIAAMLDGMESITTISVVEAAKDYMSKDISCKKSEYIGFVGNNLVSSDKNRNVAFQKAAQTIENIEEKSTFVILKGAKITDEDESLLDALLEEKFPDLGREYLYGGQSVYDLIVGVI